MIEKPGILNIQSLMLKTASSKINISHLVLIRLISSSVAVFVSKYSYLLTI